MGLYGHPIGLCGVIWGYMGVYGLIWTSYRIIQTAHRVIWGYGSGGGGQGLWGQRLWGQWVVGLRDGRLWARGYGVGYGDSG